MLPSFNWKELNSYEDFGILINELPSIPKPQKIVKVLQIEGRSGALTIDTNAYAPISFPVKCTLLERNNKNSWNQFYGWEERIDAVKDWLEGSSDLFFSWWGEGRYYKARVTNIYEIEQARSRRGEFIITFNAEPFCYVPNCLEEIVEQGQSFRNRCNYLSTPKITIYGQGNIILTIKDYWRNEQVVSLFNVIDEITIDSTLQECYKDEYGKELVLCNEKMLGEFPVLNVEKNYFSWVGNVTSIDVHTNGRCL